MNTHVSQHSIGQDLVRLLRKTTVQGEDEEIAFEFNSRDSISLSKSFDSKSPEPSYSCSMVSFLRIFCAMSLFRVLTEISLLMIFAET